MEPLIALFGVTAALRLAGACGIRSLRTWHLPLRGGVSAMFLLTGGAHFVGLREELVAMVPPSLPAPELLVTLTGILELAGAIGLWWRPTTHWAAAGLTALLVAMFPANVHWALSGLATDPMDALLPRTLLQIVFLAAAGAVTRQAWRAHRRPGTTPAAVAAHPAS